jgi:hypothetical protein
MGCLYQTHIFIYMRCYIYLHKRLDTDEVFYIGRGTVSNRASGKCDTNTYSRAFAKHNHNIQWLRITKKTSWSVEIIEDNLSWEESILSEIFYIKKYGRLNLNEGTLVNYTDGGEGSKRLIVSDHSKVTQKNRMSSDLNPMKKIENKLKQSIKMKENNPMNNTETQKKVSDSHKLLWVNGTENHPRKNKPREDLRLRNLTNNPTKNPEVVEKIRRSALLRDNKGGKSPNAKKVMDVNTGKIYPSIKECAEDIGISHTSIYRYIKKGKVIYCNS